MVDRLFLIGPENLDVGLGVGMARVGAVGGVTLGDRDRHAGRLVAQGLQADDVQPQILGPRAHIARLAGEKGQIVLENLDGPEARAGDRRELGFQRAAHGDRRNRPPEHPLIPHALFL